MKLTKYFLGFTAAVAVSFGMQSCYQDMDNDPAYDYPIGFPDPTGEYNRQKLSIPFDGDVYDQGTYQFLSSGIGTFSFPDGINGKAYKGDVDTTYILVQNHPAIAKKIAGEITNLGSYTVAFWYNTPKNNGAFSFLSITNTTTFWSNLDVMFDNPPSDTRAAFKIYMQNARVGASSKDKWITLNLDNAFGQWEHLAVTYDGATSTIKIYRNGAEVLSDVITGFGDLQFANVGPMIIGTFPFQAKPSLTTGAKYQSWATWYKGSLDQLHFYSEALSESEIVQLYNDKD